VKSGPAHLIKPAVDHSRDDEKEGAEPDEQKHSGGERGSLNQGFTNSHAYFQPAQSWDDLSDRCWGSKARSIADHSEWQRRSIAFESMRTTVLCQDSNFQVESCASRGPIADELLYASCRR
jgi:hypothetical protein